jgi:hypothetical protein
VSDIAAKSSFAVDCGLDDSAASNFETTAARTESTVTAEIPVQTVVAAARDCGPETTVPEPGAYMLLGLGLVSIVALRRRACA